MKFISPGGWFSLEVPVGWHEFEDSEEVFLFYNPEEWNGNFRISAFKGRDSQYAAQCLEEELRANPTAVRIDVGPWKCAYSAESFTEEGTAYTTHYWVTGRGNVSLECSFTVAKGSPKAPAEAILQSLELRTEGKRYPREIIPIRVLEIGEVNAAYEWVSSTVKKQLTKDFTGVAADLEHLQQVMDSGRVQANQRAAWEQFGLAFGAILVNEIEGMEWVTVMDGPAEYPALQYRGTSLLIDPAALVWNAVRQRRPISLKSEYEHIYGEAEAALKEANR